MIAGRVQAHREDVRGEVARGVENGPLAAVRVEKAKLAGVEHQPGRFPGDLPAVEVVAGNGMPQAGHVHAQLVRPSGAGPQQDQGGLLAAFQDQVVRQGSLARVVADHLPWPVWPVADKGQVHPSFVVAHDAPDQGQVDLAGQTLLELAAQFGLNPEWLKTGRGPAHQNDQGKTALIPKVSARACAGGGSLELGDTVVDELPFDRSWLSRKGNPARMVAMEVVGDSMSPELEPGDNILIDQSQNRVADNNLYVVGLADTIQVKRVQVRPGLVILFSTNQRYSPVTLQGDEIDTLRVIGRVLWSSRAYA